MSAQEVAAVTSSVPMRKQLGEIDKIMHSSELNSVMSVRNIEAASNYLVDQRQLSRKLHLMETVLQNYWKAKSGQEDTQELKQTKTKVLMQL